MTGNLGAAELEVVEAYLDTLDRYRTGVQSFGEQCVIVSLGLVNFPLPNSRLVWLVGDRSGRKTHNEWGESTEVKHAVVCVRDSTLVDLTRKQYEPDAPEILVYPSINDAGRHWKLFVDYDDWNGTRPRRLPKPSPLGWDLRNA